VSVGVIAAQTRYLEALRTAQSRLEALEPGQREREQARIKKASLGETGAAR
jgi:hypothetical protein